MTSPEQAHDVDVTWSSLPQMSGVDVALGAFALGVAAAVDAALHAGSALSPVARAALDPPGVPRRLRPRRLITGVGRRWAARRESLEHEVSRRLDVLVPAVVAELLRRARMSEMLVRYVDLDQVVAAVDLDAAADRLDVERVASRLDLDRLVERVDIESVLSRVDVDSVVQRLDVEAVLARIDLTAVVVERVDLEVLVNAVLEHVDLVALVEQVIDEIDLPAIIRDSTGSMASDTVQGARMQGIAADEAVGRAVDRLLLRRRHKSSEPSMASGRSTAPTPDDSALPGIRP